MQQFRESTRALSSLVAFICLLLWFSQWFHFMRGWRYLHSPSPRNHVNSTGEVEMRVSPS